MSGPNDSDYQDFVADLGVPVEGRRPVRVLASPAGEARGTFEHPFTREEIRRFFNAPDSGRGARKLTAAGIGRRLFDALFRDEVRETYLRSLERVRGGRGLRIKIRVDPADPDAALLHSLPWELLYRADTREFLARQRRTPVVRHLDVPEPGEPPPVPRPLRILVVMASPSGLAPLDLAKERASVEKVWREHEAVEVEVVVREGPRYATLERLRHALVEKPWHVVHFMGHGDFDPATGRGVLYFEDGEGGPDEVDGPSFADTLRDVDSLRLVIVNACHSAEAADAEGRHPFAGVATALVRGGVTAVVAVQAPISDRAAVAFSRELYHRLAAGDPVDAAVTEGRRAVGRPGRTDEWAKPVLFLRSRDGRLFSPGALRPPARPASWSRRRRAAGVLATLVTVLAVAWILAVRDPLCERECGALGCAPPGVRRVLVGAFENHLPADAGPALAWPGDAADFLAMKLALVSGLQPLDVRSQLTDERARRCVDLAVRGSVSRLGQDVVLKARLSRRGGLYVADVEVRGAPDPTGETILTLSSRLAFEVLSELGLEPGADLSRRILRTPTLDPEALEHNVRGVVSFLEGDLFLATLHFETACELDPGYADAVNNLGRVRLRRGEPQAAVDLFREAISLLPRHPSYHHNLGLALDLDGRPEEAVAALRETLELDPVHAPAYNNLGYALLELGRTEEAARSLERGLAEARDERVQAALFKNLGRVAFEEGAFEVSVGHFDEALKRFDPFPEALFYRAMALERLGRVGEACIDWRSYEAVLEQDEDPERRRAARQRDRSPCEELPS